MKSTLVALKNRFPDAQVLQVGELGADVFAASGELLCSVRNGIDAQKENGAKYEFSLEPIPKDARRWKQDPKHGGIVKDERFAERSEALKKHLKGDRIQSEVEAKAEAEEAAKAPKAPQAPAPQA